ncbi:MAG TPA: hydantoinase B/oxoprolinase family protein, partial [Dehalococcoidia bacterium]|nr:hydantoinase B/oxoprolinase family protein [Dehalococcoidia bacterium]
VDRVLAELEAEGRSVLKAADVDQADVTIEWTCEMRYRGQGHEIPVPLPREGSPAERQRQLLANFEAAYRALYGRTSEGMAIEILTWRGHVSGPRPLARPFRVPGSEFRVSSSGFRVSSSGFRVPSADSADESPDAADNARSTGQEGALSLQSTRNPERGTQHSAPHKGSRPAYFPEAGGYVDTPVYDRYALTPGFDCEGPAIFEERESTIIAPPGARVTVDDQLAVRVAIAPATLATRRTDSIDPITLEVIWNRLISVCNEQARALIRTSFTPILREAEDLSAGIFDSHGRMLAQAVTGTPGHINSMAGCIPKILAEYPAETLDPGDVFLCNDPNITSGHLPDLLVATPIFRDRTLIGWFASICHCYDIGGLPLGAMARDVYEEGLFLPAMKLFRAGRPNEDLFRLIRSNVRAPHEVIGDLDAQVAGNAVGGRRLAEFLDEFGLPAIDPLAEEIITRSERAVRAAIAAAPDGRYASELWADGFDEPIRIACQLEIQGDEVAVDFTGSSPKSRYGINVVLNYTQAYTLYGVKCALCPDVPNNEGSFRPIRVTAPAGSILNAQHPAPVAARHTIGHFLAPAVFAAVGAALPERVIANGADALWGFTLMGERADGRTWSYHHLAAGGMGARPTKDGLSATSFPSRLAVIPVEMMETLAPVRVLRKELRPDSGGAGRFRGGLGQTLEFQVLGDRPFTFAPIVERIDHPAQGLAGGRPGAPGGLEYSIGRTTPPKQTVLLPAGAIITLDFPGGGGFWRPDERGPAAVLEDVRLGLVTPEQARTEYRVVLTSNGRGPEVDLAATSALRKESRVP